MVLQVSLDLQGPSTHLVNLSLYKPLFFDKMKSLSSPLVRHILDPRASLAGSIHSLALRIWTCNRKQKIRLSKHVCVLNFLEASSWTCLCNIGTFSPEHIRKEVHQRCACASCVMRHAPRYVFFSALPDVHAYFRCPRICYFTQREKQQLRTAIPYTDTYAGGSNAWQVCLQKLSFLYKHTFNSRYGFGCDNGYAQSPSL